MWNILFGFNWHGKSLGFSSPSYPERKAPFIGGEVVNEVPEKVEAAEVRLIGGDAFLRNGIMGIYENPSRDDLKQVQLSKKSLRICFFF